MLDMEKDVGSVRCVATLTGLENWIYVFGVDDGIGIEYVYTF